MAGMPRQRKPYVQKEINRHGNTVWYFRRGDGPRTRLRGDYESVEWLRDYEAAFDGKKPDDAPKVAKGTLKWLVQQYKDSGRFLNLAVETQKMRGRILNTVCKTGGDLKISDITPKMISAGRVRREAKPFAAVNFVKVMSQLCAWAVDAGHMDENPALKVKAVMPGSDGHHTWSEAEVEQFHAFHPIGTRPRLAMDLMLYTGLRRGDAVKLGRQHIRNGVITYRASKNDVEVVIPLLPPLAASIAATETGDLAFLVTAHGRPWVKESFGAWFGEQCKDAGVPGRAHGLRKAGATFAAENGANEFQLSAMYGWKSSKMAGTYVRKANKATLAKQAANALSPHLEFGAGESPKSAAKSKAEK